MPWLETLCEVCHEDRERSILAIHESLLACSTGELLVWAKRITKERKEPKRKLEKQAKLNPPAVGVFVPPIGGKSAWDQMREAANGLLKLQEVRGA